MELRIARHTARLAEVVTSYRDQLELEEIGHCDEHDGYSGVMLGIAGTSTHLEFTSTIQEQPPVAHVESLLVLYLGSSREVGRLVEKITETVGPSANPYWDRIGVTVSDPDGFRVVLVPAPGKVEHHADRARW